MGYTLRNRYILLEKNGLLRADRKYRRLDRQNQKSGDFICPHGHLFLALVEDAPTPLIPQPAARDCEVLPQLRLIYPPTRNLSQLQIPLSSPFLLIIAVYLDICRFRLGEVCYAKGLKGACVCGILERSGRLTTRVEIIKKIGMNCYHHKIYDPI